MQSKSTHENWDVSMKIKLLLLLGCIITFASTIGASNNNLSSWNVYENENLSFSINYPVEWFVTLDTAFRMPYFRSGLTERLALFSDAEDPLSGELSTNGNHCLVEVFVTDMEIPNVRPIIHIGKEPKVMGNTILDNGIQGHQVSYRFAELQIYEYLELYIPYSEGTLIFALSVLDAAEIETCTNTFNLMLSTLSINQGTKYLTSISLDFSANDQLDAFPRILEIPFHYSPQKAIAQGWVYTFSTAPHNGIDYIEGAATNSSTWRNFDVLAAAIGDATYLGDKPGWGHTVLVKHIVNGAVYYTLYAHLASWNVPGSNNWVSVNVGDKIGVAGKSGSGSGNTIHLHFETSSSSWGTNSTRFDPYDLRTYRKYYPGWDKFIGLGTSHSWQNPEAAEFSGVTLFEHPNYGGWSLTLTEHDLDLCDNPLDPAMPPVVPCFTAPSWTNNASSIKISPGWQARLHKHNIDDANYWGDDATQGVLCGQNIPDFQVLSFPDGTPLNENVSRIYVWKCNSTTTTTSLSENSIQSNDPCTPSSPPSANDNAAFVADVTLPDGTVVSPNQSLTKTWRLRNTSSSPWGSGYQLVFVSGNQMGGPNAVNVPATAPGNTADINVNLVAPNTPGTYTGNWRLRNAQGTYFGPTICVRITVPGGSTPPPVNAIELSCTNCPSTVPPGHTFRPTIWAQVNSGQLLGSRGDMLRNTDGNLFGAWPHVAVTGVVNTGQSYDFTFYADNPIQAPSTPGTYQTKWRAWQDGQWSGPEFTIQFQVQEGGGINRPPNPPTLTGPGDWAVYTGNTGIS